MTGRDEKKVRSFFDEPDVQNRVTDMSLVPRYMRPFCEGKQIYWTKETKETNETGQSPNINPYRAGIYFRRQNLTSVDVRF